MLGSMLLASHLLTTEAECLATVLYNEARGESTYGQLLVAETVINRIEDPAFPDSLCGVVNQPGQYETKKKQGARDYLALAVRVLDGRVQLPDTGALYFVTRASKGQSWLRGKALVESHGNHLFFR